MKTKLLLSGLLGVGIVAAVIGGGWYLLHRGRTKVCPFSGRVIHPQTRAFVSIGGKHYETCCLRCAIIEAQQTGKPLRVIKVADFNTGRLLNPDDAWFVEGSAVNLCMRTAPGTQSPGRTTVYLRAFDRCSPSVLAFADEQHARAFMAQSGGTLKRLADLQAEAETPAAKVQRP